MRKMIAAVASETGKRGFSALDVAAGSGDVAAEVTPQLQREGIQIEWTLLDRSGEHLRDAEGKRVVGDALALPFADASFDLVTCSLFLHHLEPDEAIQFMAEGLRVARVAVLISDLRRNWLHLALTHAGKLFYRSPLTWNDAPASVRRAYTPAEIREMAQRALPPPATVTQRRYWMMRSGTTLYRSSTA
jgi:ubiquinone/menaquinone biosynthesis C-methylase UbiE